MKYILKMKSSRGSSYSEIFDSLESIIIDRIGKDLELLLELLLLSSEQEKIYLVVEALNELQLPYSPNDDSNTRFTIIKQEE